MYQNIRRLKSKRNALAEMTDGCVPRRDTYATIRRDTNTRI